jgi:AraC family L-rhamnose operon regulatory protein RhaS
MTEGHSIFHISNADTCDALRVAAECGQVKLQAVARGHYPGRRLPSRSLLPLRSVGWWDAPTPQKWGLNWHRNEGLELTYLERGRVTFATEEREYSMGPGDITITRPWQLHRVGNPNIEACKLHWIILDVAVRRPNQEWKWPKWLVLPEEELHQLTTMLRHNERPLWHASRDIGQAFLSLTKQAKPEPQPLDQTRIKLGVNELLLALNDMLHSQNIALDESLSSTRRCVQLFLDALPSHLEHPWTLDSMARQCGLRRSRFAHYCREITNLTAQEYLTKCRVEAATKLLKHNSNNITQIAERCGFGSSQYFATVFRQEMGISPREYRITKVRQN